MPLIALVVSLLLLAFCVWQLVPVFKAATSNDTWQVGMVQLSGSLLKTALMLIVFVVVGGVIGSTGWLLSAGGTADGRSKAAIPLLVATGVMTLLGQTNLPATMVPMPILMLIALTIIASTFLNRTVYGRYLLALGRNEEAARYSGINTKRMVVVAYVLCSLSAGLGGVLFSLDINSIQPAGFGNFYELYAIAAAVLGGCSLRGGEGNILGVVIGAAVMRVLYNAINILGISTKLEFAIIGIVILAGAIVDVVVKRMVAKRAVQATEEAEA
jgi:ABC-type xylose transport system permease subunit